MPRYSDDPRKRYDWPEFAYSVGLFHSFQHPEVIVIGLPGDVAHGILNGLADEVRSGHRFSAGEETENLIEGYPCTFRAVPPDHLSAHFGWARWYYDERAFPALQLIYPDRARRWPWDAGVSAGFRAQQPVLATAGLPAWVIK